MAFQPKFSIFLIYFLPVFNLFFSVFKLKIAVFEVKIIDLSALTLRQALPISPSIHEKMFRYRMSCSILTIRFLLLQLSVPQIYCSIISAVHYQSICTLPFLLNLANRLLGTEIFQFVHFREKGQNRSNSFLQYLNMQNITHLPLALWTDEFLPVPVLSIVSLVVPLHRRCVTT